MINAIIIDDEADGRDALRIALEKYFKDVHILGIYETPQEGIEGISKYDPDLVFLDIQMPQMSGFDVLKAIPSFHFEVIFVTAFDQYAIKAIRFSALDYLLKPVDIDDLREAIDRVKERLEKRSSTMYYQSVLHNVSNKDGKVERIAVPTSDGIEFFQINDIIYCKADGSYTTLILKGNVSKIVSRNLKDFETYLADAGFCRVHHSFLINLDHVKKYIKGEGGYVIMTDDHHVDISRRKKEEFMNLLNKL